MRGASSTLTKSPTAKAAGGQGAVITRGRDRGREHEPAHAFPPDAGEFCEEE